MKGGYPLTKFTKKFVEDNIRIDSKTKCWTWPPGLLKWKHHRQVYNLFNGVELEINVYLCSTCGNEQCVNPDHREERHGRGSERDSDAWVEPNSSQFKNGLRNPKTKLKPQEIPTIKALLNVGVPLHTIAGYFGLRSRSTIHMIKRGVTWTHVPWPTMAKSLELVTLFCRHQEIGLEVQKLMDIVECHKRERSNER
jgi:hypothetical protein